MKIREVIDRILEYHPKFPDSYDGCDNYKCGNPDVECTGVVTAITATIDVIKEAVQLGCNLIVVHEPTFYSTPDYPGWKADFPSEVYDEKAELIDRNGICIWRDHDHMHANRPDSIFTGVIKTLGWEAYEKPVPGGTPMAFYFEIPEITVKDLGLLLKEKLRLNGLRYVGNDDDVVSKVAIVGHLPMDAFGGGSFDLDEQGHYHEYAQDIIKLMENGVEAIIPGEVIDWTVVSYIRDAVMMGKKKAVYNAGHFNWEEPGMEYAAEWIEELTEGKLPVHFVPAGDIYEFM